MSDELQVGIKIVITRVRTRQPDPYVQEGWKGEITYHEVVTEADAKASNYELYADENIYTVKWDNGYISDVYPENGDWVEPCES
jgi:hypothetical protein